MYIQRALLPDRILNHFDLIKEKSLMLDSNKKVNGETISHFPHLELQLTDRCNLSCFHCHFRDMGNKHFRYEWINIITRIIKPKAISLIGGGEPTLFPRFSDAVMELSENIPAVKIGLITNGVIIPDGEWHSKLSWIRVSYYNIDNNTYCGKSPKLQRQVLKNIFWYLNNTSIENIGVSYLVHARSIDQCVDFIRDIASGFKEYGGSRERFNIQFKTAFIVVDPNSINDDLHQKNMQFQPTINQISRIYSAIAGLMMSDPNIQELLANHSNYKIFEELIDEKHSQIIEATNPNVQSPSNFNRCYYSLAFQLIVPSGDVYPCPTIGEFRDAAQKSMHILDYKEIQRSNYNYFYAPSLCCNRRFCRYEGHNRIVEQHLKEPKSDNFIEYDPFF